MNGLKKLDSQKLGTQLALIVNHTLGGSGSTGSSHGAAPSLC